MLRDPYRPAPRSPPSLGALETRLGALGTGNACYTFNDRPACCHEGARRIFSAAQRGLLGIAGYLGRRTAIACLHDRDDRALLDIGLARFQIEAAVHGLITLSGQADEGMMTFAAAMDPRGRQRAPTVEVAPWS